MPTTIQDIIKSSMRKIGVLAAGEDLPAAEGADALKVMNQMVDAWSLENLLIPVSSVVTHTLVDTDAEYTIGVYGTTPIPDTHIETARPEEILSAYIRSSGGTDYTLDIMSPRSYADISRKVVVARPQRMYVRNGYPWKTLIFDSVPYDSELLVLEVTQPLTGVLPVASLTETIAMPPGYEKALVYNLCLELAPEWGAEITPIIAREADSSKKLLKRSNWQPLTLKTDDALRTLNNQYGTYYISEGP